MTFYILAKDEYDDRLILGGPVKFRSQLKETDISSLNYELKVAKAQQKNEKVSAIQAKLDEIIDPLRDLILVSKVDPENMKDGLGYKKDDLEFILMETQKIQENYKNYVSNTTKLMVNEENIHEMIFTEVAYSNQHRGILLQA